MFVFCVIKRLFNNFFKAFVKVEKTPSVHPVGIMPPVVNQKKQEIPFGTKIPTQIKTTDD